MEISELMRERFHSKYEKSPNGCWEWKSEKHKGGYGTIGFNGKTERASRLSYMIHKGEIPKGMHVCHTCDNPPCVNPEHLFIGTASDNAKDAERKGRLFRARGPQKMCRNGHDKTDPNNVILVKKKGRANPISYCKTCFIKNRPILSTRAALAVAMEALDKISGELGHAQRCSSKLDRLYCERYCEEAVIVDMALAKIAAMLEKP